ncbi:hypothetical protein PENSPDRAFT_208504 [Peniophora sp. CONT]|nr:hypothetical protein PENSPDRAFT_208504 [Peniophora sp. CONT]
MPRAGCDASYITAVPPTPTPVAHHIQLSDCSSELFCDMDHATSRRVPDSIIDPNVDVILRSSDNIEFYSHRRLLTLASPFFAALFTLPAPVDDHSRKETEGRLPVIRMTENENALRILLSLCDADAESAITAMDDLVVAARLVAKFELSASSIVGHFLLCGQGSKARTQTETPF